MRRRATQIGLNGRRRMGLRAERLEDRRLLTAVSLTADLVDQGAVEIVRDEVATVGQTLFFVRDDGPQAGVLYRQGPSDAVASPVDAALSGPMMVSPVDLTPVGDRLFFKSRFGDSLAMTDGDGIEIVDGSRIQDAEFDQMDSTIVGLGDRAFFIRRSVAPTVRGYDPATDQSVDVFTAGVNETIVGLRSTETSLFFIVQTAGSSTVYTSDGTASGTSVVANFPTESGLRSLAPAAAVGNQYYFLTQTLSGANQVFASDGTTAAAEMVLADWQPDVGRQLEDSLFAFGSSNNRGVVIESAEVNSNVAVGNLDRVYYTTDGTTAGTNILAPPTGSSIEQAAATNLGDVYFRIEQSGVDRLAKLTINSSGSVSLQDNILPGVAPVLIGSAGDRLLVSTIDSSGNLLQFLSDGTPAGTIAIASSIFSSTSIANGFASATPLPNGTGYFLTAFENGLSYQFAAGVLSPQIGSVLSGDPRDLTPLGDQLLTVHRDADAGVSITSVIKDGAGQTQTNVLLDHLAAVFESIVVPGQTASDPDTFAVVAYDRTDQQSYLFIAREGQTVANRVTFGGLDLPVDSQTNLNVLNGQIVFWSGGQQYTTDGLTGGTAVTVDPSFGRITFAMDTPNQNYFATVDGGGQRTWFVTPGGLSQATRFGDGIEGFTNTDRDVTDAIELNGRLIVTLGDRSFWSTDGTTANTFEIQPNVAGSFQSGGGGWVELGGRVFGVGFVRDSSNPRSRQGAQLIVTDGGARSLSVIPSTASPDYQIVSDLVVLGNHLVFVARDNADAADRLWISDTTAAGTEPLGVDIDVLGQTLSQAGVQNGQLYFSGRDADRQSEVYVTDGTAMGTYLVADVQSGSRVISPGQPAVPLGSSPAGFTAVGDRVYFSAFRQDVGRELFAAEVAAPQVERVIVNDGQFGRSRLTSLEVVFDSAVRPDPDAIELQNVDGTVVDDVIWQVRLEGSQSIYRAEPEPGNRLPDGEYRIVVDGRRIKSTGLALGSGPDTVASGIADGLFQKFGDTDGDAIVGLTDLLALRRAYGASSEDARFEPGLDRDANGVINLVDLLAFRDGYGR